MWRVQKYRTCATGGSFKERLRRSFFADGYIPIHAPHAGSDGDGWKTSIHAQTFQSTLPMRGATSARHCERGGGHISIHAPHAGSDPHGLSKPCRTRYFNPRSPCGERLRSGAFPKASERFQSTLPMRGATDKGRVVRFSRTDFNPRSPCGERQKLGNERGTFPQNFNPRSPCGERPLFGRRMPKRLLFQSTLPMRGATVVPDTTLICR